MSNVRTLADDIKQIDGDIERLKGLVAKLEISEASGQEDAQGKGRETESEESKLLQSLGDMSNSINNPQDSVHRIALGPKNSTFKVFLELDKMFPNPFLEEWDALGDVLLLFQAAVTVQGVVYIVGANVIENFNSKGVGKLSAGGTVTAFSYIKGDKAWAEILFLVYIGGPDVTKTTTVKSGAQLGVEFGEGVTASGEHSITLTEASTTSNTMVAIRRYKISSNLKRKLISRKDIKGLPIKEFDMSVKSY